MKSTKTNSTPELDDEGRERRAALRGVAGLVGLFALSARATASNYLSAPGASPRYPYTYRNSFPANVGDFPARTQVGGDVFAHGLKPGDKFPADITVLDEKNAKHSLAEFIGRKPLIVVLTLISAPEVMRKVATFQKFVERNNRIGANVIVIHVGQFGSVLQPNTPMANTGRTVRYVAQEYRITLPFYWVNNDIYSPNGLTNRLRVRDLPTIFLVGDSGRVVRVFGSSHTRWSSRDLAIG